MRRKKIIVFSLITLIHILMIGFIVFSFKNLKDSIPKVEEQIEVSGEIETTKEPVKEEVVEVIQNEKKEEIKKETMKERKEEVVEEEPTPDPPSHKDTYEDYMNLSYNEKVNYIKKFNSLDDFYNWFDSEKAVYDEKHAPIESDGEINIGG